MYNIMSIQHIFHDPRIMSFLSHHNTNKAPTNKAPTNKTPTNKAPKLTNSRKFRHNTILIVCDQLIKFNNIPDRILKIMPGYQAFKSLGIEFDNIYNNRQDCSPSRGSFATSQLNINISDNIDQSWQYNYNPELNTSFDTIGKSLKRHNCETVWYGKNHFVSAIATDVYTVPAFDTNTRGCLKEYGYDIYNTFGDTYYYTNQGIFTDNMIMDLKVNYKNNNVDYVDSSGKYIGALPYLKARSKNDKKFHLEVHLENPHDTQHFWQNLSQQPAKSQSQFWVPYIRQQIILLKKLYPDSDIYDPYNFSDSFPNAYIQNPNLIKNYFETVFEKYITNVDSMPFKESYLSDYVLDPLSNNSQFPYFIGQMLGLQINATIPNDKQDIMSWKNLINNYYGLILEIDHYIYKIYLLLKTNNMLSTTSVVIMSDHGDEMSAHGLKQKGYHFENGCNVACLIASPYIPPRLRGTKNNVLGSLLDIAPTIETLANIKKNRSGNFLGTSLLNWNNNNALIPRTNNIPVFNIYNSWLTYFTYFYYAAWIKTSSPPVNTVLTDFNPSNFYNFQSFFTMIVDNIDGKKYKLARYFNFIELLLYNWVFNDKLSGLTVDASMIINNLSEDLINITIFNSDIDVAKQLVNDYFNLNTWNFKTYYQYVLLITGQNDNLMQTLLLIPIINITTSNIGFSYKMPGYYNDTYTTGGNFLEYYDDPDHNYYYFMYNVTDDPNEITNLLDKGYPNRQTPQVMSMASVLNDNLNLLIDKYKIVYFDFIVPNPVFISMALNLKINKTVNSTSVSEFTSCFGLNKSDGDIKTQPYYDEVLDILTKLDRSLPNETTL